MAEVNSTAEQVKAGRLRSAEHLMFQALLKIVGACYRTVSADDARPRRPRCRFCERFEGRVHASDCVMWSVNDAIAHAKGRS